MLHIITIKYDLLESLERRTQINDSENNKEFSGHTVLYGQGILDVDQQSRTWEVSLLQCCVHSTDNEGPSRFRKNLLCVIEPSKSYRHFKFKSIDCLFEVFSLFMEFKV